MGSGSPLLLSPLASSGAMHEGSTENAVTKGGVCFSPSEHEPPVLHWVRYVVFHDAGFHVFHAACAAALATDIIVDLSTFFHPPAPYHQFFVLTTQAGECNNEQGGIDAINRS